MSSCLAVLLYNKNYFQKVIISTIREMIDEEVNNDPEMSAEAENFDQHGIERKIFCDGNVYKQMEEGSVVSTGW